MRQFLLYPDGDLYTVVVLHSQEEKLDCTVLFSVKRDELSMINSRALALTNDVGLNKVLGQLKEGSEIYGYIVHLSRYGFEHIDGTCKIFAFRQMFDSDLCFYDGSYATAGLSSSDVRHLDVHIDGIYNGRFYSVLIGVWSFDGVYRIDLSCSEWLKYMLVENWGAWGTR